MKTRSDFQALLPYFHPEAQQTLRSAALPHLAALQLFDVHYALNRLQSVKPTDLTEASTRLSQGVRKFMFEEVPAYRDYSAKHGEVPIDKQNYLRAYDIDQLVPEPASKNIKMISVSSGSSGTPYFWPRGSYLELETSLVYEMMLEEGFQISKKRTLLIDAYSMGTWVAGVFTLTACLRIAERGYPLTIMTPGINMDEVLKIISQIGHSYEQIIICGYPPFVKDIIEEGARRGVDWSRYPLRFIFGAEAISEAWRAHLYKSAKINDYYHASMNTYGTADAAIIGHETPLTILIKRLAENCPLLMERLFRNQPISTFVQYYPDLKHIQIEKDELLCTTYGGLPVYRYNLHDTAAIYTFDEIAEMLTGCEIDIFEEAKNANVNLLKLPFIALFGKSDQTVTLYGLNVYPQTIRAALEHPELIDHVTARMSMHTKYDDNQDQYIHVLVELHDGVAGSKALLNQVSDIIHGTLLNNNSEYAALTEKIGEKRSLPRVELVAYGTTVPDRGKKQPWIIK